MSMQVHVVSDTTLFRGDGVGGRLLSLSGLLGHNPHTAGLLFCWLGLRPGFRVVPVRCVTEVSFILEIVSFLEVGKGSMWREPGTVLVLRGTLGVQTGVHVVVEKHGFGPVDGWVQGHVRLQVLTVQIHSTRVCASCL